MKLLNNIGPNRLGEVLKHATGHGTSLYIIAPYLTFFAYGQIYDVLADSNPSEPTFINVHGWHQGDQASNADKVME